MGRAAQAVGEGRSCCSAGHVSEGTTKYLLLTTHYLLLTTYYLLLATCYLLLTAYYLLLTTYCLPLTLHVKDGSPIRFYDVRFGGWDLRRSLPHSLLTTYYLLLTTDYLPLTTDY